MRCIQNYNLSFILLLSEYGAVSMAAWLSGLGDRLEISRVLPAWVRIPLWTNFFFSKHRRARKSSFRQRKLPNTTFLLMKSID